MWSKNAVLLPYILTGAWWCLLLMPKLVRERDWKLTKLLLWLAFLSVCLIWHVATGSRGLKTVKVRVVVEVGCYPTETPHVVKKGSRWEKAGSTGVHSVSYYFDSFTYSAKTKWGCSILQEFLNHIAPDGQQAYPATLPPLPQLRNMHQSIPSAEHSVW